MTARKRSGAPRKSAASDKPAQTGAAFGVARPLSAAAVLDDPANAAAVAVARLAAAVDHLVTIEQAIADEVVSARAAGVSWALIGDLVGLTGEGARQRYADLVRGSLDV